MASMLSADTAACQIPSPSGPPARRVSRATAALAAKLARATPPVPTARPRASRTTFARERGLPTPQIWLIVASSSENHTSALHSRASTPTPAAGPLARTTPATASRSGAWSAGRRVATRARTCSRAASLFCRIAPARAMASRISGKREKMP
jgi:hypothetical protein